MWSTIFETRSSKVEEPVGCHCHCVSGAFFNLVLIRRSGPTPTKQPKSGKGVASWFGSEGGSADNWSGVEGSAGAFLFFFLRAASKNSVICKRKRHVARHKVPRSAGSRSLIIIWRGARPHSVDIDPRPRRRFVPFVASLSPLRPTQARIVPSLAPLRMASGKPPFQRICNLDSLGLHRKHAAETRPPMMTPLAIAGASLHGTAGTARPKSLCSPKASSA